jgi:hypothetical protein
MRADADRFRMRLGADERPKLDLYFDSLREVEKGLGGFAAGTPAAPSCGPTSAPATAMGFEARVADMPQVSRLFLDLMAVSLACGVTRVATMMWGGGECWEDIPFLGVRNWHSTSHADPNPSGAPGAAMIKIQAYLAGEFAYFTQKLKSFGDGPGSLFDTTIALWGTQNGNPDQVKFSMEQHDRRNTPFVLTGRGNGAVKLGRVLDCNGLNHNDLYISIAQAFGLGMATVGNPAWCKGPLPGLAG